MLFLHLPSANDDCTSLAFQTMGVRDLAVAFHHGHRCSKSNQLPRTNEIPLTRRALFLRNAPPLKLGFAPGLILLHATSFAQRGPCFIQLPSFQILTCNPPPINFPAMMTFCTLLSPARGVRGLRVPKLPSAPRSAGQCTSIMDAVFILFWRHQRTVVPWFECVFADIFGHTHPSVTNLTQHRHQRPEIFRSFRVRRGIVAHCSDRSSPLSRSCSERHFLVGPHRPQRVRLHCCRVSSRFCFCLWPCRGWLRTVFVGTVSVRPRSCIFPFFVEHGQ